MKEFTYTITDELGLHARPAGMLAKEAMRYKSKITLEGNGKKADAKRLFAIMGMGIKCGMDVHVTVEGEDEEKVCTELEAFFKANA